MNNIRRIVGTALVGASVLGASYQAHVNTASATTTQPPGSIAPGVWGDPIYVLNPAPPRRQVVLDYTSAGDLCLSQGVILGGTWAGATKYVCFPPKA